MAVLVLTVNLKWNCLNFVSLHTDKLLKFKTPNLGAALVETCALPAREVVLPLLAFAGLSQECGPVTAQGIAAYGHTGKTAGPSPATLSCIPALVPGNNWCHNPWDPWDPEPTLSLQGLPLTSPPEHLKAGVSPTLGDF